LTLKVVRYLGFTPDVRARVAQSKGERVARIMFKDPVDFELVGNLKPGKEHID